MRCRLQQNAIGRWILAHSDLDDAAWSGSQWVEIDRRGFGRAVQVCNFETEDDAYNYALTHGFTTITVHL